MMKRVIVTIFSCILIGVFFIATPSQINVFAQSSEDSTPAAQTKTVTQTRNYSLNQSIPSSIPYNVAGWSGTLYLINTQSTGDRILATFRGSVHCSGFCGMSLKTEEDEQN